MSPVRDALARDDLSFPRVSGDEPDLQRYLGLVAEFSPRERG